jgi:anti-sigma factor RsiW
MTCADASGLLHGYADQELDLRTSLEIEQHLKECASCAHEYERLAALRSALKENSLYYDAPAALRTRVRSLTRAAIRSESGSGWRPRFDASAWRWPVTAMAAAVLVAVILRGVTLGPSSSDQTLGREIVSSHVRSLMVNHLTDILSSNQHTVKPWFDGKLDFAPIVLDLSAQGFPLAGGRLEYVDGHPAAALVYHYRLHVINLFTWPTARSSDTQMHLETREGYNSIHWTESAMEYWAVSDVAPSDLERLAQLVRAGTRK